VGALILWRSYQKTGCASHRRPALQDNPLLPSGLFFMGVGMAATPCLPLSTVMLTAASTSSPLAGLYLGMSFGIGAVIIPALAFGIGMAYFGQRIRLILHNGRTTLERGSALLLIIMGFNTLVV
jgi:sulfite exporter TauE/SafE